MRAIRILMATFVLAGLLIPSAALAAGGGKVEMLVVVADTRMVHSPITLWFLNVYNTSPTLFGILCVVLTAAFGCTLGFAADFLMARSGLDLTSRKLIEH